MRKILPILIGVFLIVLFLGVPQVSAQSPRRYYDWSTTLENQNDGKVLGTQAFAQEATGTATAQVSPTPPLTATSFLQFDRYIIGGNLSPDSPFHFLKTFQETVQLTFTFDAKKKDVLRLEIAGERLGEAQKLSDAGKVAGIATASDSYRQQMLSVANDLDNFKNKNQNIDDLLKTVEVETAKHNVVLEKVEAAVPDSVKDSLAKAIEASEVNIDKIADLNNRPAVPPDVVDRISALKAQGLLTAEEAQKLISSKTRSEARGELRKYVNEGVFPPSDFLRMNENVKAYFPEDFYEIHEVKRFYTMKKLEQAKPDEATLGRIQEFAKTYNPGEIVPADIRKYWGPIIQLDEIQSTLRPDLIDPNRFKNNPEDYKKFNEIVERYKPRPEDVAFLQSYITKNNASVSTLPPEYQRMYNMSQTYGAQCGSGQKWYKSPGGGYCAPEGFNQDQSTANNLPLTSANCKGNIVSVKSAGGICSAFPSDCVPADWTRVDSCIITPGEEVGERNTDIPGKFGKKTSCPSNAHFVPVPFDPSGGYCVPNYTPTGDEYAKTGGNETSCPAGYHRNYSGGACLADLSNYGYGAQGSNDPGGGNYLPPLTNNPGNYPNPFYSGGYNNCGSGSHWVPEPINPSGGYCAPDNYQPASGGVGNSVLYPQGNTSNCQAPKEGCGSGNYWDGGSCACRSQGSYPSSCQQPAGGCPSGWYWNAPACSCNPTSPQNAPPPGSPGCTQPSGGCPSGWTWVSSACSCNKNSSSGESGSTSGSSGGSYSPPPPSGYGSCSGGQHWNGTSCVTSTSSGGSTGSYTPPPPTSSTSTQPPPPPNNPPPYNPPPPNNPPPPPNNPPPPPPNNPPPPPPADNPPPPPPNNPPPPADNPPPHSEPPH